MVVYQPNYRIRARWLEQCDPPVISEVTERAVVEGRWQAGFDDSLPLIDLSPYVVIPGFVDMHTHVTRYPEVALDLLRWGVTVIRELGSTWEAIERFRMRAHRPEFITAGPLIDGVPARWPHISVGVDDVTMLARTIEEHREHGVQWVKVYYRLEASLVRELIHRAHAVGLRVAGHLGLRLRWEDAVRMGIDTLEHVRLGVVDRLLPSRIARKVEAAPWPWKDVLFWEALNLQHPRLRRLLGTMAKQGTVWVPTLEVIASFLRRGTSGWSRLPEWHRRRWLAKSKEARLTRAQRTRGRRIFARILHFTAMVREEGVKIMVGTDTPNVGIEPGRSYHRELRWLAKAGFSIGDLLNAAVVQPREYLGLAPWGRPGDEADFVVLGVRQIHSVRDLHRIVGVYRAGRWYFLHPTIRQQLRV